MLVVTQLCMNNMQPFKKSLNKSSSCNYNFEVKMQNDETAQSLHMEYQFYKTNRIFLIIFQLFLSGPMGIHKARKAVQKRDLMLYRAHALLCLSVCALLVYSIYKEYDISMNMDLPNIHKTLYFAEYFVYLLHLLELIRIISFCREKYWQFHTFIIQFDSSLLSMKVQMCSKDLSKFFYHHMALILLFCITCTATAYLCEDCANNHLIFQIVYMLPNVIIDISLLHYYALLFIAYKRGEKLNFLLIELLNGTATCSDVTKLRNEFNLLRSLFAKVNEFTKNVNEYFSNAICLVYLGSFINISVHFFLLYKNLNEWNVSNLYWIAYTLVWICTHIGKMLMSLHYNQKIQNVRIKATTLLSSFKLNYPGVETTLERLKLELMSDTRNHYVNGILHLNMNFATSLLVAISTLLIYLIQYDVTYEALGNNPNSGPPPSFNKHY